MALVLHVLMLFLLSGGSARVVTDFEQECGQFFANGNSPTTFYGLQYKQICQTLNGVPYYATYYDTHNKIPVYSAYRFEGIKRCKRRTSWYIEPQLDEAVEDMAYGDRDLHRVLQAIFQLDDETAGEDMASEGSVDIKRRGVHQALNGDYKRSGFDKGHLAPVYQAESQSCAFATFTLTNAAPQVPHFNTPLWRDEERKLAQFLESQCRRFSQPVYIVTGVVPGPDYINNTVNVPSHFWSAYCCLDQNNRCSKSGGVIGTNEYDSNLRWMPVADLEGELQNLYGTEFRLFYY